MSELQLKAFEGGSPRFRRSNQPCPRCALPSMRDDWPPDYAGGHSTADGGEWSGSAKYVCVPCRLAFRVHTKSVSRAGKPTEETRTVFGEHPLVERDGFLLTPYDVRREQYREEHGEYPTEVYG